MACEFNTKVKIYKDGTMNVTYCSNQVYGKRAEKETDNKEDNIAEKLGYNDGYLRPDKDNAVDDYSIVNEQIRTAVLDREEKRRKERSENRTDSIKRSKDKVFDIVYQNEFKYFVTLTLRESDKVDRRNPKDVIRVLSKWLNNAVTRKGLQYILIPEYHHDSGGIHAHALINDCFRLEDSGRRIYHGKAWKVEDLENYRVYTGGLKPVFNIPDWKYGFSTAIPLDGEVARVAYYITKYVTKDIQKIFGKFFWSSKNIVRDTDVHFMNVDYNAIPKKEYSPMYGLGFKYERHLLNDEDRKNEWNKEPDIDYGEIEWV